MCRSKHTHASYGKGNPWPGPQQTVWYELDYGCVRPALGTGTACNLGGGTIKFLVTLASGQTHVEVFSRQNGAQNLDADIVGSESSNRNGTSTYSYTKSGYQT